MGLAIIPKEFTVLGNWCTGKKPQDHLFITFKISNMACAICSLLYVSEESFAEVGLNYASSIVVGDQQLGSESWFGIYYWCSSAERNGNDCDVNGCFLRVSLRKCLSWWCTLWQPPSHMHSCCVRMHYWWSRSCDHMTMGCLKQLTSRYDCLTYLKFAPPRMKLYTPFWAWANTVACSKYGVPKKFRSIVSCCQGELHGMQKSIFIEPLVAHMRHPHALEECTSPRSSVHVSLSASYETSRN